MCGNYLSTIEKGNHLNHILELDGGLVKVKNLRNTFRVLV